jgi:hypothetical protein
MLISSSVGGHINVFVLTFVNLQPDKMKLIILKFHIFYTYFTVKKILEVNKKQNKNLKLDREAFSNCTELFNHISVFSKDCGV